ncbi:hypothetical protein COLO4_36635 [Corchorus olitorius]|uniref:Uncharacterized protein n=1 Tax=Corchorus olitorius TaxID=93759 RepID=A0A1R3G784_9ROSI|nr:hypothetical protein COLO4_36635 [Corchorus olitorius]
MKATGVLFLLLTRWDYEVQENAGMEFVTWKSLDVLCEGRACLQCHKGEIISRAALNHKF